MHRLSRETVAALRHYAETGVKSWRLADGGVQVVHQPLPGRCMVAVAQGADTFWVIVDPTKPEALDHLGRLIDTWPLGALDDHRPATTLGVCQVVSLMGRFRDRGERPVMMREVSVAGDGPLDGVHS